METQTRFNLNRAIADWRQSLASQPGVASTDARELEEHLREQVARFQQGGLRDDEAFWVACRRVGSPADVAAEFAKANPLRVWRDHLFWAALVLFMLNIWQSGSHWLIFWWNRLMDRQVNAPISAADVLIFDAIGTVTALAPFILLGALAIWGKTPAFVPLLLRHMKSRGRILVYGALLVAATQLMGLVWYNKVGVYDLLGFARVMIWQGSLLLLAVWLVPAREQKLEVRTA
jgi:hypothetical protein